MIMAEERPIIIYKDGNYHIQQDIEGTFSVWDSGFCCETGITLVSKAKEVVVYWQNIDKAEDKASDMLEAFLNEFKDALPEDELRSVWKNAS